MEAAYCFVCRQSPLCLLPRRPRLESRLLPVVPLPAARVDRSHPDIDKILREDLSAGVPGDHSRFEGDDASLTPCALGAPSIPAGTLCGRRLPARYVAASRVPVLAPNSKPEGPGKVPVAAGGERERMTPLPLPLPLSPSSRGVISLPQTLRQTPRATLYRLRKLLVSCLPCLSLGGRRRRGPDETGVRPVAFLPYPAVPLTQSLLPVGSPLTRSPFTLHLWIAAAHMGHIKSRDGSPSAFPLSS